MNRFTMALAVIGLCAGAGAAADERTPPRPAWMDLARESKLPLHSEAVESELWATRDEARMDVLERASTRVANFAAEAAPHLHGTMTVPTWVVQDHMLREPIYIEEVAWDYGPMYRANALLDLSPNKRELVLSQWHAELVHKRITQIGGGLGFLLVCVATLFSYLRLDDATRGYYSRWLATGGMAVVAASAAAFYRWIC
jgi:hypothetical protein